MSANININPSLTTNAAGSFGTTWEGLVQGTAFPDPATRFALTGGVLDAAETLAMYGGVALFENVPGANSGTGPMAPLGPIVGRANGLTGSKKLAGFSVFDQGYAAINSPQSPVPLIGSGGQVMYYRLGSGARIAVACDPTLLDLQGGPTYPQVSWDWVNQILVPYEASAFTISSGTYNDTTGEVVLTLSAAAGFGAGDAVVVSSLTGTGSYADLDGTWTADAVSGSTVSFKAAAGNGAATITGGSLTLGSGTASALPVKVLDVQSTNNMTVAYDPTTTFATWNRNGSAAVILI